MSLPADNPEGEVTLLAAIDGREMVGAGLLVRPLLDNQHTATVDAYVRPDRTREGIGRRLVAELEVIAAGDGRTTLHGEAFVPPGVTGTAPEAFAAALGYDVASRESMRELRVGRLPRAASRARRRGVGRSGVRHRHLRHRVPGRARRVVRPTARHAARRDPARRPRPPRVRVDPSSGSAPPSSGRSASGATCSPPSRSPPTARWPGRPTSGSTTPTPPAARSASRWSTRPTAATASAWRSRSRPTTWRVATYPSLVTVDTSNAEVNTHMNAVNDALGYRTIETLLELQKKL